MFPSGAGGDPADSSSLDGSLTSLPPIPPAASKGKQKLSEKGRLDAAIIGVCLCRSCPTFYFFNLFFSLNLDFIISLTTDWHLTDKQQLHRLQTER